MAPMACMCMEGVGACRETQTGPSFLAVGLQSPLCFHLLLKMLAVAFRKRKEEDVGDQYQ